MRIEELLNVHEPTLSMVMKLICLNRELYIFIVTDGSQFFSRYLPFLNDNVDTPEKGSNSCAVAH